MYAHKNTYKQHQHQTSQNRVNWKHYFLKESKEQKNGHLWKGGHQQECKHIWNLSKQQKHTYIVTYSIEVYTIEMIVHQPFLSDFQKIQNAV
jgi:hypothetical protein